jgi:hypothetical protein
MKKLFALLISAASVMLFVSLTRAVDADSPQGPIIDGNQTSPAIQKDALTERIAIFGDSHVERLGPELWAMVRMAEKGGVCQFKKQRGSKAAGWIESRPLRQWLAEFDPNIVIIVFGTNEAMSNAKESDLIASFEALAKKAKDGRDRRIVWVSPPKLETPPHLDRVWEALRKTKGIELMDFSKRVFNLKPDGTHLEFPAYRAWVWEIADRLRNPQRQVAAVQ